MEKEKVLEQKGLILDKKKEENDVAVVEIKLINGDLQINSNLGSKKDALCLLLQVILLNLEKENF